MLVAGVDVALRRLQLRVAEELHHDLAARAAKHQPRAEAVPERVDPVLRHPGVARDMLERAPLRLVRRGSASLPLEDPALAPGRGLVLGKHLLQPRGQRHRPRLAGLGRSLVSADEVAADLELALLQVDVLPPQRAQLARPQPLDRGRA